MASEPSRSVVASVLVLVVGLSGILLVVYGAYEAVHGISDPTSLNVSIGAFKLKTTQVGLALLCVGAFLAFIAMSAIPQNVQLFGADQQDPGFLRRIMLQLGDIKPILLILSVLALAIGAILFLITVIT